MTTGYLRKKLKRLLGMGVEEILFRLRRKIAGRIERALYYAGAMEWSENRWKKRLGSCFSDAKVKGFTEAAHRYYLEREEPSFPLDTASLEQSRELFFKLYADRLNSIKEKADRVCEGRFSFLGIEFAASDPIAWHRDPKGGTEWPKCYHGDVPIRFCDGIGDTQGGADVKHVWELNRHEFLLDCAKAFFLTRENRYADRVFSVIASWSEENPYLLGVNWAGPLEVAVRAIAWLWCYRLCRSWKGHDAERHVELIRAFYLHGAYLFRHIERYTSPNNHWVGEAAALYMLGSFFPEFDEAEQWKKLGWDILAAEPANQFYADGGSTEHSNSYHHYGLGFFLLAMAVRMRQRLPAPESMRDRLEKALEFSLWMTTPDGTVPRIGDGDDSRSIRFESAPFWDFRSILSLGAAIFERSDFKAVAGEFGEDALWLLGDEGYSIYERLPGLIPSETVKVFSESGYAILRSGWAEDDHHLCFDCGPIGKDLDGGEIPLFTHGHADLLSLTLCAFGKPLLVDGGFYTFGGSPEWHRYFRDVQGHNAISVDGASPAKFEPANAWSHAATPERIQATVDDDRVVVTGSHAGFVWLKNCVRHRRTISWDRKSCWTIRDDLIGVGEHFVEVIFHFAPGVIEKREGSDELEIRLDSSIFASLRLESRQTLEVQIRQGEPGPDGGWIASSYGRRIAAPRVRFSGRVALPITLSFEINASRSTCIFDGCEIDETLDVSLDAISKPKIVVAQKPFCPHPRPLSQRERGVLK